MFTENNSVIIPTTCKHLYSGFFLRAMDTMFIMFSGLGGIALLIGKFIKILISWITTYGKWVYYAKD